MTSRRGPSKSPPARAAVIASLTQRTPVVGVMSVQQAAQTQPRVGRSRGVSQAAQRGASETASNASAMFSAASRNPGAFLIRAVDLDAFGGSPQPFQAVEAAALAAEDV